MTAIYEWLTPVKDKLNRLNQSGRLPHAVLLEGAEGIGKRTLARFFAQELLCSSKDNGTPCGKCKDCLLFTQHSHPDYSWIEPDEKGKQIKVQQIRTLSDFVGTHAQQGGYRVIVIAPAEAMNIAASNALLKSLEEPGDNTLFLLITDRPGQILPTIKSRCQRIAIPTPSVEQSLAWLEVQNTPSPELALGLSGGSPLLAKALTDNDELTQREHLIESLKNVAGHKVSVPDAAKIWVKGDLLQSLGWLSSLVNDMLRFQQLEDPSLCRNKDAEKLIIRASQRVQPPALFAFSDKIQDYRQLLLAKHNPNPQLLCEEILITWLAMIHPQ